MLGVCLCIYIYRSTYYFQGIGYKDIEYEEIEYTAKIALKNLHKPLVLYRKIAVI